MFELGCSLEIIGPGCYAILLFLFLELKNNKSFYYVSRLVFFILLLYAD